MKKTPHFWMVLIFSPFLFFFYSCNHVPIRREKVAVAPEVISPGPSSPNAVVMEKKPDAQCPEANLSEAPQDPASSTEEPARDNLESRDLETESQELARIEPPKPSTDLEKETNAVSDESDEPDETGNENLKKAGKSKPPQVLLDEALDYCQEAQDQWQKGELENALESLDKAYALIIGVEVDDNAKLMQQKEDLRFMISKRILEIYASRHIVVNGNHNAIPIELNRHVQAEINLFTKGVEKDFFLASYKRSGRYRCAILKKLEAAGLPTELSWLPLIESGYKSTALSRARALGLWQFIPSTGYKFGLKRDKYIDERLDPDKSTDAAIAYLKELHQIFGDWTTVLASYNCGEGRVLRLIRNQNINYLDNFWDLYQRLPPETARYVPRFLATLYIMQHPEKYGFDKIKPDPPLEYEIVEIQRQAHLKNVAAAIGTTLTELVELNPELRYKILPNEKYRLRVPVDKTKLLLAKLDTIPVSHTPQQTRVVIHKVRSGETLSTIARKYRTSINSIARANNMRTRDIIRVGKRLRIPKRGYAGRKYSAPSRKAKGARTVVPAKHVVKSGDSLWILAKRYGTTTKKIMQINNLGSTRLHIGQVLRIRDPGKTAAAGRNGHGKTHTVRPGDNPFSIARRHQMSVARLLKINRLTPKSTIYPGQVLQLE